MSTAHVIAAAGSGTRLGAGMPKALAPLSDGRPLLVHCLEGVAAAIVGGVPADAVVVLVPEGPVEGRRVAAVADVAARRLGLPLACVQGRDERALSVRAGLAAVSEILTGEGHPVGAAPRRVLVHDAARALTPPSVFHAVHDALEAGAVAAVPGIALADTVKEVAPADRLAGRDRLQPLRVTGTPSRSALRAVQTPQGFDLDLLLAAHETAAVQGDAAGLTDDAMVMEAAGHEVAVVPGAADAFKVTTPFDLDLAAAVLARRAAQDRRDVGDAQDLSGVVPPLPRVGIGTDIHRWAPEDVPRPLWLGGVHWPGERGVAATSDGDVAAHAACNALLSAAGLGDLGAVFGTDRWEMRDASGASMLAEVLRLLTDAGLAIGNVAVQIVAPRPKLGPRRAEMEAAMSAALDGAAVSVSAATTDGLGFIGDGEGLVGLATALVVPVR